MELPYIFWIHTSFSVLNCYLLQMVAFDTDVYFSKAWMYKYKLKITTVQILKEHA